MLFAIILIAAGFHLLTQLFVVLCLIFIKNNPKKLNHFPAISIFVPARNEGQHILQCLESLEKLNYPKDKIEILVGNDASTDNTEAVVKQFVQNKPNFYLFNIHENFGKARYKANVLAQLAHKAQGDFYFFCDSDTVVRPEWAKALLAEF